MSAGELRGDAWTVTLTPEEAASWAEDGRAAAAFRVSLKRPARLAAQGAGARVCLILGPGGNFLEECFRCVKGCDATIPARAAAWFGDVAWHPSPEDVRTAGEDYAEASDDLLDGAAWRLEAVTARAAAPGCDLDPASPTGAAVIAAANARLLARLMAPTTSI